MSPGLDWLAGSRGHFVQVFSERALVMVPPYLLGADQAALDTYGTTVPLPRSYLGQMLHPVSKLFRKT